MQSLGGQGVSLPILTPAQKSQTQIDISDSKQEDLRRDASRLR